jgi:hypothetical protein
MGSEPYSNTAMTCEQLKRKDEALQTSARRMLERMQAIIEALDQQWALLSCNTGQRERGLLVVELDMPPTAGELRQAYAATFS